MAATARVWFITGTSQGFGLELVRVLLKRGDKVIATSRKPEMVAATFRDEADRLMTSYLDLHDAAQIATVVSKAVARFGHIDVLVNNAGYGLLGAIEEASEAEIAHQFDVNVFGVIRVTQAVLPHMRRQKSGHIVNISSMAGLRGSAGVGIYNATKFALEGLSEAWASELEPLGIRVTVVEPGPFRTNFLGNSLVLAAKSIPDYADTAGTMRRYAVEAHHKQVGDPVRGAEAIVEAVLADKPPLHLALGRRAYDTGLDKADALRSEFERWRDLALACDYPEHPTVGGRR